MKTKIALAGALLGAFLIGAVFEGVAGPRLSNAFTPSPNVVSAPGLVAQPQDRSFLRAQRATHSAVVYREAPVIHHHRSRKHEIMIVAGSAGAGTAIGALAGGKKGAGIGAVSGGVAGLAYDLATRNK